MNRTFQGTIARFSGRVQSATRTMETEVDVPNPSMVLMPGMYADAILVVERKHDVLTVPVQAVSAHDTAPEVLVVNSEKKIEPRPVKLGLETSDKVEITSGLRSGELVVVGSRAQLKAGQTVTPRTIDAVPKEEK